MAPKRPQQADTNPSRAITFKPAPQKPVQAAPAPTHVNLVSPKKNGEAGDSQAPIQVIELDTTPKKAVKDQDEDSSSGFDSDQSKEEANNTQAANDKGREKKAELKMKLELLRAKLKKAKNLTEKSQMLEKERDRELQQINKAKQKQQAKEYQTQERQKKQTSKPPREENKQAPLKKKREAPSSQTTLERKKERPRHPATSSEQKQEAHLDPNASETQINFANKLHLVDEFAKRWSYALPEWPPADFDYEAALKKAGLEICTDALKLREPGAAAPRVIQVEGYEGVFRDVNQKLYDMRPQETMPSLKNFQKMSTGELQKNLLRAYEAQHSILQEMCSGKRAHYDRQTELELIQSIQKKIARLSNMIAPNGAV